MAKRLLAVAAVLLAAGAAAGVSPPEAFALDPGHPVNTWSKVFGRVQVPAPSEATLRGGGSTAQVEAVRRIDQARRLAGYRPFLRGLGTIGLTVTAVEVGYHLGGAIDRYIGISAWAAGPNAGANGNCTFSGGRWDWTPDGAMAGVPEGWVLTFNRTCDGVGPTPTKNLHVSSSSPTAAAIRAIRATFPGSLQYWNGDQEVWWLSESQMEGLGIEITTDAPWTGLGPQAGAQLVTMPSPAPSDPGATSPTADAIRTHLTGGSDEVDLEVGKILDPDYTGPPSEAAVPDCTGMTAAQCEAELRDAGLLGTITEAELGRDTADLTYGPGRVIRTNPAKGVTIGSSTPVEFTVNPAPLPLEMQALQHQNETYSSWETRLRARGYTGTITYRHLTTDTGNPELGPDTPVRVLIPPGLRDPDEPMRYTPPRELPDPTPRIWPDDPITVEVNPPDMPESETPLPPPAEPGAPPPAPPGTDTECNCPPVDFGPLTDVNYGDKFPFGVFAFMGDVLDLFNASPDAPRFDFDMSSIPTGAVGISGPGHYVVDLDPFSDYMAIIRTLISVALWVGAVWYVGTRLLGFTSSGDPGEAADEALPL